ncbi:MAG: type II toxin-antitoxin system PemK/MazF family toxin [Spirochaetes bacterium]|nr:type II toxin-antitoxin system PemK/MazF family toxin [Spirochaetota bacterium]
MTIYKPFDVVEVPFPFSDLPKSKRRKALVISSTEFNERNGATILMMITSATHSTWLHDVPITRYAESGLKKPCVARMKLFTLDNGLILQKSGELAETDISEIEKAFRKTLPS